MRSRWKWSNEDLLALEEMVYAGYSDEHRRVARVMGLKCSKTVAWWINKGYLKARRGQPVGRSRMWYISEDALHRFLADPAYWHLWTPDRVTDALLRGWVSEIRNRTRFLTTGQVGALLGVKHTTVNDWIHKGLLPAVRHMNWLIRESDLRGFIPPCERSKKGRPRRPFSAQEDAVLRAMQSRACPLREIAAALGRSIGSIYGRQRRLAARERQGVPA